MKAPILPQTASIFAKAAAGKLSIEEVTAQYEQAVPAPTALYTGRYFVLLDEEEEDLRGFQQLVRNKTGMQAASISDFQVEHFDQSKIEGAEVLMYDDYKIALVGGEQEQVDRLQKLSFRGTVVPERVFSIPDDIPSPLPVSYKDSKAATWGLTSLAALESPYTGKGIKVCILDTGVDTSHPFFKGRRITARSFVPGEGLEDGNGHGTHCIGVACGGRSDTEVRYGVASESEVYAYKVLNNTGCGPTSWIVEGILAAKKEQVDVMSLSLGSSVGPGAQPDPVYNRVFKKVDVPVVVAAGNDSRRGRGIVRAVGSPANSPYVLAVGAIDARLRMADFSNGTVNNGQEIALVAPGVEIYSSWTMPIKQQVISGTSMATPYVAGVFAQLKEKYPKASAAELKQKIKELCKPLPHLTKADAGAGLVQSPS